MTASVSPSQVRRALLMRDEIALLDLRHEAAFATGHPLFAANMAAERIALEAGTRLPRKNVQIVVYDAGEGLIPLAADRFGGIGVHGRSSARRRAPGLAERGLRTIPGCEFLRQGLWRTGRVPPAHALVISRRSRKADCEQSQYRGPGRSAVRRICHHEHTRLRQRARRGTGAPRGQHCAGSRDDDHRQLRRSHPIDHRHPVAHQRRCRQQGAGAEERDDRLDSRKPRPRAWC
jgi:hypothetical protein